MDPPCSPSPAVLLTPRDRLDGLLEVLLRATNVAEGRVKRVMSHELRQIERAPKVVVVLATAQLTALWTRNSLARTFGNQYQTPVALDNDQNDVPVLVLPAQRPRPSAPTSMPTLARIAADRKRFLTRKSSSDGSEHRAGSALGSSKRGRGDHQAIWWLCGRAAVPVRAKVQHVSRASARQARSRSRPRRTVPLVGANVLVQAEQVVRVVLALEGDQTFVIARTVRGAHVLTGFLTHEVDVRRGGGVRGDGVIR